MLTRKLEDGNFQTRGAGPLRPIICEAETRSDAVKGYCEMFKKQWDQWRASQSPAHILEPRT